MGDGYIKKLLAWVRSFPSFRNTPVIAENQPKWRPIATAPRDGTVIWLRFGSDGVSPGRFIERTTYPWKFVDNNADRLFENYSVDGPGGPSHWLSLGNYAGPTDMLYVLK